MGSNFPFFQTHFLIISGFHSKPRKRYVFATIRVLHIEVNETLTVYCQAAGYPHNRRSGKYVYSLFPAEYFLLSWRTRVTARRPATSEGSFISFYWIRRPLADQHEKDISVLFFNEDNPIVPISVMGFLRLLPNRTFRGSNDNSAKNFQDKL